MAVGIGSGLVEVASSAVHVAFMYVHGGFVERQIQRHFHLGSPGPPERPGAAAARGREERPFVSGGKESSTHVRLENCSRWDAFWHSWMNFTLVSATHCCVNLLRLHVIRLLQIDGLPCQLLTEGHDGHGRTLPRCCLQQA